jgi:hypothetical protein
LRVCSSSLDEGVVGSASGSAGPESWDRIDSFAARWIRRSELTVLDGIVQIQGTFAGRRDGRPRWARIDEPGLAARST